MCNIQGKNILLIMPLFFGYENKIKEELRKAGAKVDIIYENIKETHIGYKILFFLGNKSLENVVTRCYYKKRLTRFEHTFDYVLVIRGTTISEEILALIKKYSAKNCRYIMYQWDGTSYNPNPVSIAQHFHAVYTFEPKDAEKYNWIYKPLFYIDSLVKESGNKTVDVCYACSLHTKRYEVFVKLKQTCEKMNVNFQAHLFLKKWVYYKQKYLDRNPVCREIDRKALNHTSLSVEETNQLYQRSKVVVDYTYPGQTGLTMRTFEALGNGCKLITNNPLVKQTNFYNENNIHIYEGTDVDVPEWFVKSPYVRPDNQIYAQYSLTNWLRDFFVEV